MTEGAWIAVFLVMNAIVFGGIWYCVRRVNEPKTITVTKTYCKKHGLVPTYPIAVAGSSYPVCWRCLGEFGSRHCTTEEVEESK